MDELSVERGHDEIRVLVVEDHDGFREGLCLLLEEHGVRVVGKAANGRDAVELARTLVPDVVLMDLDLPELSGIEAIKRIAEVAPVSRVVVLTVSGYERDVVDALLAGASGYLVKGTSADMLVHGIQAVLSGTSLLSPGIANTLVGRLRGQQSAVARGHAGAEVLSQRELEVLQLLAAGKQNSAIADELYVSVHTVRNHISNILAKLQIHNRTEATAFAIRAGLV